MKVCIYLTSNCNHKCKFCNVRDSFSDKILPAKRWIQIIEKLEPSFIVLFGGEPLLYPEYDILATYIAEKNIPYTVITTLGAKRTCEPLTLSIDAPAENDKRSAANLQLLEQMPEMGYVVNTQIHPENVDFAIDFLSKLDTPWLVDIHHYGRRKDGEPYILRCADPIYRNFTPAEVRKISGFLIETAHKNSLETNLVYEAVMDAYTNGWFCSPEHHVEYLTIGPDGKLLACVDLPLDVEIDAFDFDTRFNEYVDSRVRVRDKLCTGCFWRHEISADMNPNYDWSTEGMLNTKNGI